MYRHAAFFSHTVRGPDGHLKYERRNTPNLRTTVGIDWQSALMGKVSGQPLGAGWIALSADLTSPAVTDTSLPGEFTTGGLARAAATYVHTAGVSSFTLSFSFTSSATNTINKTALFNAATAGTMPFESLESTPAPLVAGDVETQVTTVSI